MELILAYGAEAAAFVWANIGPQLGVLAARKGLGLLLAIFTGMALVSILMRIVNALWDFVKLCWKLFQMQAAWFIYLALSIGLGVFFTYSYWTDNVRQDTILNFFASLGLGGINTSLSV